MAKKSIFDEFIDLNSEEILNLAMNRARTGDPTVIKMLFDAVKAANVTTPTTTLAERRKLLNELINSVYS